MTTRSEPPRALWAAGWVALAACNPGVALPDSGVHVTCAALACGANASCVTAGSGPSCVCDTGYTGDGETCTDIDECATATAVCSPNATCTNRRGSYNCDCNTGYTGDGVSCTKSCGNGTCEAQAGETCDSCPADCGVCDCPPCDANNGCPSGMACGVRNCDGTYGCYASGAGSSCPTIGGLVCPSTPLYSACTSVSDCCGGYDAGCPQEIDCVAGFCARLCQVCGQLGCSPATPRTCPDAPGGTTGLTAGCNLDEQSPCPGGESCADTPTLAYCALSCSAGSTCPAGLSCHSGHCTN